MAQSMKNDNPLVNNKVQVGFPSPMSKDRNINFEEIKSDFDIEDQQNDLAESQFIENEELLKHLSNDS